MFHVIGPIGPSVMSNAFALRMPQAQQEAPGAAQGAQVISGGAAILFPVGVQGAQGIQGMTGVQGVRKPGPKDWSPRTCRKGTRPWRP